MATEQAPAVAGKGPDRESKEALMEQVAEYIKVSKETSKSAYELACMAQDLGSLWSSKRRQDDKSLEADEMIKNMVGDRIPYTFGKRGSDTIPTGLAALSHFLAEDPRHFGVRLSTLFTGSNFIQERRKVATTIIPKPADVESSLGSDSEDSMSSVPSQKSSSSSSVVSSLDSEEMDNFDALQWYHKVEKLVSTIQSKEEWETISALRAGYSFRDGEQAADLVHVEALADLNDEELRAYQRTKDKLETQVEAKQLEMLTTLTSFSDSLRKKTKEVLQRRRARKKVKKRFSFSNMDEVRFVVKDGEDFVEEPAAGKAEIQTTSSEVDPVRGHRAGQLLTQISALQSSQQDLVRDCHIRKQNLDVHEKARAFMEEALNATDQEKDPPEPDKDVQELLQKMQAEVKGVMDKQKRATEAERLKQVAADSTLLREEDLVKLQVGPLKVQLTLFENDVEMLQKKVQELENAKIAAAKGGTDKTAKARKAALVAQQATAEGQSAGGRDSHRPSMNIDELRPDGRASPTPQAELRRRSDEPPPSKKLTALQDQVPAAQKAVDDLNVHKEAFLKSAQKAKALRERFPLDPKVLRRSFLAGQESPQPGSPEPPAAKAALAATPASPAAAAAAAKGATAEVSPTRARRSSRVQVKPAGSAEVVPGRPSPAGAGMAPGSPKPGATAPAAPGAPGHSGPSGPVASATPARVDPALEPANAGAPGGSPAAAPETESVDGFSAGQAAQMKALTAARKALEAAGQEARRLGKALDMNVVAMTEQESAAILGSATAEQQQKKARVEELEAELHRLRVQAGLVPEAAPGGALGALTSKEQSATGAGFPGSPASTARMDDFQRAKLEQQKLLEELTTMEGQINPELLKELLAAQGENLHIQEQIIHLDEVLRLLKVKGSEITKEDKEKIKVLLVPPQEGDDPDDPQVQELRNEKRKMKGLQKEVQEKRGEWSGVDGVSKALEGLQEGVNPSEVLRKVRMVNAAMAKHQSQNSSEDNSPARVSTMKNPELATWRAAASLARANASRSEMSGGAQSSPRTPATAQSVGAAERLLKDAVSAMADSQGPRDKKPRARRASANDLVAMKVPMSVAINMRRRQSLAAGLRAAEQDKGPSRQDGNVMAITAMGTSAQAVPSSSLRPGRARRATDAQATVPRRFSGIAPLPAPRRMSLA